MHSSNGRFRLFAVSFALLGAASLASIARAEARVLPDVPYKPDGATEYERERCKLDLYLPEGAKDFPTIVWFHGGALRAGDKRNDSDAGTAKRFASEGIAFASANYRLDPQVGFPAYIEDAAAAVAFVRKTIAEHGGSPDKVYVSGHSAGGYMTAMLAMDAKYLAAEGLKPTDFAAYLPVSGQMLTHTTVRAERGNPESRPVVDDGSPAWYIDADAPPILCIAGGSDLPGRAEENRWFVSVLRGVGDEEAAYAEFDGRDHGTVANRMGEADDPVRAAIVAFMKKYPTARR